MRHSLSHCYVGQGKMQMEGRIEMQLNSLPTYALQLGIIILTLGVFTQPGDVAVRHT